MLTVTDYYKELLNFCARTLKDRNAAADLVQEAYMRFLVTQRSGTAIADPRAAVPYHAQFAD
ncbi:sigma factor [Nitrosomonas sp. H1_AOB3]|uniref:sigma factor n=1 Tax=Nitrosomonas sp. H1_AOB3 TaxID=2741553 RepID=UPI00257D6CE9|nr:sigma factor [Nitrosomonas sp. H1_AOB3]